MPHSASLAAHSEFHYSQQQIAWQAFLAGVKALPPVSAGGPAQKRVFISYAWYADKAQNAPLQRWLERLQHDLQTAGLYVFLDLADMQDHIGSNMQRNIGLSDAVLIIGTPRLVARAADATTSLVVELRHILAQKAKRPDFQIMPLLYEGSFGTAIPPELKDYLVRDCREPAHYAEHVMALRKPLGMLPAILGRRVGDVAYEGLLADYRLAELSNLPAPNPNFRGRDALLVKLHREFSAESSAQAITHRQVIGGLGGVGKTQLALAYAHRYQQSYGVCRWLAAEGEQLSLSMRRFAEALGIDTEGLEEQAIVHQLYQRLRDMPSWLLIFDNADTAKALATYLPQQQGLNPQQHILITSLSQNWPKVVNVDVFSPEEAATYIGSQLGDVVPGESKALAEAVAYLPLALSQAVAYIQQAGIGIRPYLRLLREQPLVALSEEGQDEAAYPHTVKTTWAISMARIAAHSPDAVLLLQACAWLHADDIPLTLFEDANLLGDSGRVFQALKCLREYSMLQPSGAGFLKVHRLVQIVTQQAAAQKALELLGQALKNYYPWDKRTQADFERTRVLLTHLHSVMAHQWACCERTSDPDRHAAWEAAYLQTNKNLANAYGDLGEAEKARELLERALPIQEAHYGRDHPQVAATLMSLGNALGALGDAAGKKPLLERALVIQERHYGRDHPEVAATLVNLGNALGRLGDEVGSKALLERALVINERHYGRDHPEVACTLMNLSNALSALGDEVGSKALLERALVIQERHYGRDHPQVSRTLTNLGAALRTLGNASGAKSLLERALVIQERHYGRDHPEVARTLMHLSNALSALGDEVGSKALLERALVINERHYGRDHPEVARTLTNLGDTLRELGDASGAKSLLERALIIQERHYGRDHPQVVDTFTNLGAALGVLGDVSGAKALWERALVIKERHYGRDHPQVASTLVNLGSALRALGDASGAKALLERALTIKERHYGRDHPSVATTLSNLALAEAKLKCFDDAQKHIEHAHQIFVDNNLPRAEATQRMRASIQEAKAAWLAEQQQEAPSRASASLWHRPQEQAQERAEVANTRGCCLVM